MGLGGEQGFGEYHPEAVGEIYDAGFDLMDQTSDEVDAIMADAEEHAAELEVQAEEAAAVGDEEEAAALEEEALAVVAAAIVVCVALCIERAGEGQGMLLDMCGNRGQEVIISATLQSFFEMMMSLAPVPE